MKMYCGDDDHIYFEIDAKVQWKPEDGDGIPCDVCQEQRWLQQYRLSIELPLDLFDGNKDSKFVICQGCYEMLVQAQKDKDDRSSSGEDSPKT